MIELIETKRRTLKDLMYRGPDRFWCCGSWISKIKISKYTYLWLYAMNNKNDHGRPKSKSAKETR